MQDDLIEVSVICVAYNHAKYIRETLEGIVMQRTNFKYEVIVHDDASTDGTQCIITEFANKYPEKIIPVLQEKNQYSKRTPIHKTFTIPLVRGKYVALCEGDDKWIDETKLQTQYDIMQKNKDCSMSVHVVEEITEKGNKMNVFHPFVDLREGKIDIQEFLDIQRSYPFQTSSYFMRSNLWKDLYCNPPKFKLASRVGDEPMLLYMVTKGKIYFIDKVMSNYRRFSIGSWSSRVKHDKNKMIEETQSAYEMMRLFDEYTEGRYECYLALYKGRMLLYEGKYKELIKKEYKLYLNHLGIKKIYIYICAFIPFLSKVMDFKFR